jgi:HEPN domain-containing protein
MVVLLSSHEESYDQSNPILWFNRAQSRLLEAEYAINNQTKVRLAIEAAELALKALLIKKGLFTEDAITHNLSYLFDKLVRNRALQSPEKVKELVDEIEHVQAYHKALNIYVDVCYSAQVGHLRYPLKEELEITDEIAKRKCDAVRRLLEIIKEEIQN